jgi:hypothetical protein
MLATAATKLSIPRSLAVLLTFIVFIAPAAAGPRPGTYWRVDDVRPGMKGYGRTVMKRTKIETFQAEVLGVLKNTSPGRDMVLCRLAGLDLEKTGIIAGMSGSPVYIDGKLLGAVAYAWPFGKEPIAGITPFCQMHQYVESYERRDLAERSRPQRVGLHTPVSVGGRQYHTVTVSQGFDDAAGARRGSPDPVEAAGARRGSPDPVETADRWSPDAAGNTPAPTAADGLWMVPLRTPLSSTGFTRHSLELLQQRCQGWGVVTMQGGGASARVADEERDTPLQPGGPLAVALVRGDFDLSGIGTVTHVEGDRVYGWGHPFFGCGRCDFPLMTGYIHTIYPRQSVSFKMGSPLKTVGVINADVSTCIAGWLGRKIEMLPVRMKVMRETGGETKTFNVEVVRQDAMLASLVYTVLTNSVDMEGELPEELTADFTARIEVEGHAPVVIRDTFSGSLYSGGRAPQALYSPVASILNVLTYNSYKPVRVKRIECETHIVGGRQSAEIDAIELDSETYSPGETLKATVFLRPYKGLRQRLPVTLKLPADLPEGTYTATVCDDLSNARRDLHDNPNLDNPQNLKQVFQALKVQTDAKRTNLVVRVPVNAVGVALDGKSLPDLPPSMVQIIGNTRRTGAQTMSGALVSRRATPWVVQGAESVHFTVTKNKKVLDQP